MRLERETTGSEGEGSRNGDCGVGRGDEKSNECDEKIMTTLSQGIRRDDGERNDMK